MGTAQSFGPFDRLLRSRHVIHAVLAVAVGFSVRAAQGLGSSDEGKRITATNERRVTYGIYLGVAILLAAQTALLIFSSSQSTREPAIFFFVMETCLTLDARAPS
jgi:hypothetical protein